MLAKVIATGETRDDALDLLRDGARGHPHRRHRHEPRAAPRAHRRPRAPHRHALHLDARRDRATRTRASTSLAPGTMTTVQDLPGRVGLLAGRRPAERPVRRGVLRARRTAPSATRTVPPALEVTATGPTLRFSAAAVVARHRCAGAGHPRRRARARCGSRSRSPPARPWRSARPPARASAPTSRSAAASTCRPTSAAPSTFTLGGFGGHAGRALLAGDVLRPGSPGLGRPAPGVPGRHPSGLVGGPTPADRRTALTDDVADRRHRGAARRAGLLHPRRPRRLLRHRLRGAPQLRAHRRPAHRPAAGVGPDRRRRGGPAPVEHPRHPLRGRRDRLHRRHPDHPRTRRPVASAASSAPRWSPAASCGSSGQLRPGDTVRFVPVREADAAALDARPRLAGRVPRTGGDGDDGVLARLDATDARPSVTYRRDGDDNVLVEYGDMTLDLALRMRVHALHDEAAGARAAGASSTSRRASARCRCTPTRPC